LCIEARGGGYHRGKAPGRHPKGCFAARPLSLTRRQARARLAALTRHHSDAPAAVEARLEVEALSLAATPSCLTADSCRFFDIQNRIHGLVEERAEMAVPAGDAPVFDGYLLHRSLPNAGQSGMRRALVNHYMSAESLLPWFPPNEHESMGTADHRDIMLVAGEDPYAFKRTTDVMHPHVRPDGNGGCIR
jgi:hypothetical protein